MPGSEHPCCRGIGGHEDWCENAPRDYHCCGGSSGHLDWCHLNDATDNIEKLCALVKDAGGTMRLYGQPIDAAGLKAHVEPIVDVKMEIIRIRLEREADEAAWVEVWSDVERVTKP